MHLLRPLLCLAAATILLGADWAPGKVHVPPDTLTDVRGFGAKGDGTTDDTQAIRSAIAETIGNHRTLYFPAGIYLVSDALDWVGKDGAFNAFLTWQGDGFERTIIKLKDSAPGFQDAGRPRALCRPGSINGKEGKGNRAHNNYIFDMAFDTGSGNPGAIGVDFNASNNGAMGRVRISGSGRAGLALTRDPGPCLIKHIEIVGFDRGIELGSMLYGIAFEHIRCRDQKEAVIHNSGQHIAMRGLDASGPAPLLVNAWWSSVLVLIDSKAVGTGAATSRPAITIDQGWLILRGCSITGYASAVVDKDGKVVVPAGKVGEFVSKPDTCVSAFGQSARTLGLPIEETPEWFVADAGTWAGVTAFGAAPDDNQDDSAGVQKAIDSGATTVFFKPGRYQFAQPVVVRGKVRRILGYQAILEASSRFVCENDQPVIIERFNYWGGKKRDEKPGIVQRGKGGVAVLNAVGPRLVGESRNSTWWGEDLLPAEGEGESGFTLAPGHRAWVRQLNIEMPGPKPMLVNDGGKLWVLMYKTEFGNTVLESRAGASSEILGGLFYPAQGYNGKAEDYPTMRTIDASVSANWLEMTFGPNKFVNVAEETRKGLTKRVPRPEKFMQWMVGLYTAGPTRGK